MKHIPWLYTLTTHFHPRESAMQMRFANILYGSGTRHGSGVIVLFAVLCMFTGSVVSCQVETETDPVPHGNPGQLSRRKINSKEVPGSRKSTVLLISYLSLLIFQRYPLISSARHASR